MMSVRPVGNALLIALASGLVSCDSGSDENPTGSTGSFTIAVSPAAASIAQSGSSFVTVTLTRSGGFSDAVALTISGAPSGVSATMDPAVLSGSTTESRIDLRASSSAALGTSTVTIAAASGSRQASATLSLSIDATPDYTITFPTVILAAGSSRDVTVNINRSNFTGGVTLALVNVPAGITGTFSPVPSTGNSAVLSLNISSTVAAGLFPLTIRGTAAGVADRTGALQLTVIPAPTAGNNVEYQFCQPDDVPAFFAYQDGSGPWQVLNGTASAGVTRFAFSVTSGRGGILIVYPFTIESQHVLRASNGSRSAARRSVARLRTAPAPVARRVQSAVETAYESIVFHGSTAELAEDGVMACAISPPEKTIRGTVAGLANFQYSILTLGNVTRIFEGGVNPNPVTFAGVGRDLLTFMGSRLPSPGSAPDRAVVFRNLNIADGGTLPSTIDFNGPASFVPASATVQITGAPGERFEVYNHVITAEGPVRFWNDIAPSQNATRPWAGLPADRLAPGEFHDILVFASPGPNSMDFRAATKYVGPVSNQTVSFAPAVNPATVAPVSAGAYPRFRFQGDLPPEYNKGIIITVSPDEGSYLIVLATNAWLTASGTASGYDLTMPDVAGLPGFPTASRLKQGINFVTTEAFGFTGPGTLEPRPVAGAEARRSIRTWPLTVP